MNAATGVAPPDAACPPPDPHPRRPRWIPPAGACDCHAHVIGPQRLHPFVADRSYTPPDALLGDYLAVARTLGLQRLVLVQPSMHGTDNGVMLEAVADIRASGGLEARAVAVIAPDARDQELEALHAAGVRGVRLNLVYRGGGSSLEDARAIAARARAMGWHLQLLVDVSMQPEALSLAGIGVPIVVDHMGHLPAAAGVSHPGFQALLAAMQEGNCWTKLSGAYRLSAGGPPYADVRPLAQALLAAAPERVVWASDWPHTLCRAPMPNDGELLDLLRAWCPDEATWRQVLVENPAALYGFGAGASAS